MPEVPATVTVFTADRQEPVRRTRGPTTRGQLPAPVEIPLNVLNERLSAFLVGLDSMVSSSPAKVGMYELDTIEVSAQIDGTGRIGFLGSGVEVTGSGGLKFVLKKS